MAELINKVIKNDLKLDKRNTSLICDVQDSKNPVPQDNSVESQMPASSSYIMMDRSQLSGDVDRWIHGESATPVSTGVQRSSDERTNEEVMKELYRRAITSPRPEVHTKPHIPYTEVIATCAKNLLPLVQRSTLTATTAVSTSGFYYALAIIMPILRARHYTVWRCSPSAMVNSLEPFFVHLGHICSRIREQFRRLATEHVVQELLSTAMDIILVVYAIGFLIISMYQSSIIE